MDIRDERSRIIVRRFAGPALHASQVHRPIRVAHLTDLHIGRVTPMHVQERAVELTNAAKPDIVAITGDFVCHSQSYLDALEFIISGFSAPVFAVLGNHDHWSGAAGVKRALRRAGAELLENSHTMLSLGGDRLQIAGLGDAYTGYADLEKATLGLRRDLPAVALSHIAEEADGFWRKGVPLVLSGHTHGGQITFAGLHELALGHLGGHRYVHGLYGRRSAETTSSGAVYVGAGIGASVMPFRVGDRGAREITIFDLGVDPGAFPEHHEEQEALPGRAPSERTQARRVKKVHVREARRVRRILSRRKRTRGKRRASEATSVQG